MLQVFDGNELLFSGCDSSGLNCNLTLYNAHNGNTIWTREVPPLTSLEAICLDPAHSRTYLLMNPAANERGVQSFVISKEDGGIVSEITGSATWSSIGSADRYFYSIYSESPPPEQRPRHTFVIKHTPEFEIKSYGVLCEYHTMHSMKLCEDVLFGCIENCSIDGAIIPYITAIFNMGTDAALNSINSIPSESTRPTVLEGRWHIRAITADEVQLIGQFNPGERNLTAITIQRSWLE